MEINKKKPLSDEQILREAGIRVTAVRLLIWRTIHREFSGIFNLADLEEIGSIIKTPDYVLYRDDEEQFYFVREYLRNHDFQKILVKVAHLGTPKRWVLLSVSRTSIEEMRADDIRYGYAKIKA